MSDVEKRAALGHYSRDGATIRFFSHGGFLYFDKDGKFLHALAVSLGTGLTFERRQKWPADCTETLAKHDRFQKVTIPELLAKGARLFAWIHAGEELKRKDGQPFCFENGAFAYLFHDDPQNWDGRDCYFEVATGKNQDAVWCVWLDCSPFLLADFSVFFFLVGKTLSLHCNFC